MKRRKVIGNLGKDVVEAKVDEFLDELDQGAVALLNNFEEVEENPEFLAVETDHDGHLLGGTKKDGGHYLYELESESLDRLDERVQTLEGDTGIDNFDNITDVEGRPQITKDNTDKIISYRKYDGTLVELAGIETPNIKPDKIQFPDSAIKEITEIAEEVVDEKAMSKNKKYFLPKFGMVNIKQETFYLTYNQNYVDKNGIVLIQMYDDTTANASLRKTLSYYYIKSTLTPLAGGGYDRTSVNDGSIRLDFYPAKEVAEDNGNYYVKSITKVNGTIYFTSTLTKVESGGTTTYLVNSNSVPLDLQIQMDNQQTLTNAIRVTQITDVPPYKAWTVNKKLEHYCVADIDFGTFYSKTNVPVSIKYQGSSSTMQRMRGLRITFFKNNTYAKKDKVKIGEMVRLSGFNMKAYFNDNAMIKDPMLSNIFIEMWESRGESCYPWNADSVPYNGAVGHIKSFPIQTWFGEEFYGIQFFSVKKDEKNYILDGDDDASGIFVAGNANDPTMWLNSKSSKWIDEFGADNKVLAYPTQGDDSVSVETAAALDDLFDVLRAFIAGYSDFKDENDNVYPIRDTTWVEGTYYVTSSLNHGAVTPSSIALTGKTKAKASILNGHIDIKSFIDYWIGLQVFLLWDNEYHNMILHTRADKVMFYPFFYDLDNSMSQSWPYDTDLITACTDPEHHIHPYNVIDMSFWEKFTSEFKDSIINRYVELRKGILSIDNITSIYNAYVEGIPDIMIAAHQTRWGVTSSPKKFKTIYIEYLKNRLAWLDETYFNLNV